MERVEKESLKSVTEYLFNRRESILNTWRMACENDKNLSKVSALTRQEFNNLMPIIFDILEKRLLGEAPEEDLTLVAGGHGLHRWHKALALIETMRELNHLSKVLYQELETYEELFKITDKGLLLHVYREITSVLQETFTGSILKYDELQRLHAAGRLSTLEGALDSMNELSRVRGDLLRKSSHDLRGSVGIASSAASLLQMQELPYEDRQMYLEMLTRNLSHVQEMLSDLLDLSRLESGQDELRVEKVDVSQILMELIDGAQSLALGRHIILQADGPESLVVETDAVKLKRIVQNLLVNALNYSTMNENQKSLVSVSWSVQGNYHWVVSVQDSGPGMPEGVTKALTEQLRPTVEPTAILNPHLAEPDAVLPVNIPEIPTGKELEEATKAAEHGEGIGLQIVKHLCNMLFAGLEVESQPGRGTLFRVRMPIDFPEQV